MPMVPRKAMTGQNRATLRKLQNALESVRRMDTRAQSFADTHGGDPVLFADTPAIAGALTQIENQISRLLDLKV